MAILIWAHCGNRWREVVICGISPLNYREDRGRRAALPAFTRWLPDPRQHHHHQQHEKPNGEVGSCNTSATANKSTCSSYARAPTCSNVCCQIRQELPISKRAIQQRSPSNHPLCCMEKFKIHRLASMQGWSPAQPPPTRRLGSSGPWKQAQRIESWRHGDPCCSRWLTIRQPVTAWAIWTVSRAKRICTRKARQFQKEKQGDSYTTELIR